MRKVKESKTNRFNIFWDKNVQFLFQNHFFFVTGVRVKFRFKDSEINFDQARSTTVNLLLRALRAICNISSDDGEDQSLRTGCLYIRNGKLDTKWRRKQTKSRKENSRTALGGWLSLARLYFVRVWLFY